MRLVEGVLLENSASPLRHYLETWAHAQSTGPLMGVDDSNFEMTFFCGVQGSNPEHAAEFQAGVLKILQDVENPTKLIEICKVATKCCAVMLAA